MNDFVINSDSNVKQLNQIIHELTNLQKSNLNHKFLFKVKKLSVRASNRLKFNLENDISLDKLLPLLEEGNIEIARFRNIGVKFGKEIEELFSYIRMEIQALSQTQTDSQNYQTENEVIQTNILEKFTVQQKFVLNNYVDLLLANLSKRAYNGLYHYLNSITLKSLIEVLYDNSFSIKTIRNIGQKSFNELVECFNEIKKRVNLISTITYEDELIELGRAHENILAKKISSLSSRQKFILNNNIECQIRGLSIRSVNALRLFFEGDFSIENLKYTIVDNTFDIKSIKNIGKKTEEEIENLFKFIIDQINNTIDSEEIASEEKNSTNDLFVSFLKRNFNLTTSTIDEIIGDYDFTNGIPVFKTIDRLIEENILYNNKCKSIFKNEFNYFSTKNIISRLELLKEIDISRERLRQLKNGIYEDLTSKFSFLKILDIDTLNLYGLDRFNDVLLIEDEFVQRINTFEKNAFNNLFVNKVISIILTDYFSLIGNEKGLVLSLNNRITHNWKNTYLVKREICANFSFEDLIEDINRRLSLKINESYCLDLETYLMCFKAKDVDIDIEVISRISKYIIKREFEISIDINGFITFSRNTYKALHEYTYEALDILGVPSNIREIFRKVIELNPDLTTDEMSIRSSLQRDSRFVPFSRTSIWGLKYWEDEQDIRGGTIRDIVEEYLREESAPKHISEITKFVNQFRNTNENNVLTNIRLENLNRFIFYKGSFVGLKETEFISEYPLNSGIKKDRNSWDKNIQILEDFILKYGRLPRTNGDDIETRCFRFLHTQLYRIKKEKIEEIKKSKISSLILPFNTKKHHKE